MTSRRQGKDDSYIRNSSSLSEALDTQVLSVYLMTHSLNVCSHIVSVNKQTRITI